MAVPGEAGLASTDGTHPPARATKLSTTLDQIHQDMERAMEPRLAAQRDIEASMAPAIAALKAHGELTASLQEMGRQQRVISASFEAGIGRLLREFLGYPAANAQFPHPKGDGPPPSSLSTERPTRGPSNLPDIDLRPVSHPPLVPANQSLCPLPTVTDEQILAVFGPGLKRFVTRIIRTQRKKSPQSPKETADKLLHRLLKEDSLFALERTLKEIGLKIGRGPSTIAECHFYTTSLRDLRLERKAIAAFPSSDAADLKPTKRQARSLNVSNKEQQAEVDEARERAEAAARAKGSR